MVRLRDRLPARPSWLGAAILAVITGVVGTVIATLITVQLIDESQVSVQLTVTSSPSGQTIEATSVRLYTPFDDFGMLRSGRTISDEAGSSFRTAGNSPRRDARRCFGDESFVHDPCFANTAYGRSAIACPDSPWARTLILLQDVQYLGRLGQPSHPPRVARAHSSEPESVDELGRGRAAWALDLVNEDRCIAITGGTHAPRAGLSQAFECERGGVIAGAVEDDDDLWFANCFPPGSDSSERVAVRVAWL
jgi:hypothetical protein